MFKIKNIDDHVAKMRVEIKTSDHCNDTVWPLHVKATYSMSLMQFLVCTVELASSRSLKPAALWQDRSQTGIGLGLGLIIIFRLGPWS